MTTTEKLQQIRAKCVELLAIAEKRTQGKWDASPVNNLIYNKDWTIGDMDCNEYVAQDCLIVSEKEQNSNARFVVACAGSAEAGWLAAIAAIDALQSASQILKNGRGLRELNAEEQINDALNAIIVAWEKLRCNF